MNQKLSSDIFQKRYDRYGGVIRVVLAVVSEQEHERRLNESISDFDYERCSSQVSSGAVGRGIDRMLYLRVRELRLCDSGEPEYDFTNADREWASNMILDRAVDAHYSGILKSLEGNHHFSWRHPSALGAFFESLFHHYVVNEGNRNPHYLCKKLLARGSHERTEHFNVTFANLTR